MLSAAYMSSDLRLLGQGAEAPRPSARLKADVISWEAQEKLSPDLMCAYMHAPPPRAAPGVASDSAGLMQRRGPHRGDGEGQHRAPEGRASCGRWTSGSTRSRHAATTRSSAAAPSTGRMHQACFGRRIARLQEGAAPPQSVVQ